MRKVFNMVVNNHIREIDRVTNSNKFVSPRCNYTTLHKRDMTRHFDRKSVCSNETNLSLTNEIKATVLC